jgi:hypothetical protein
LIWDANVCNAQCIHLGNEIALHIPRKRTYLPSPCSRD